MKSATPSVPILVINVVSACAVAIAWLAPLPPPNAFVLLQHVMFRLVVHIFQLLKLIDIR